MEIKAILSDGSAAAICRSVSGRIHGKNERNTESSIYKKYFETFE
jgi:hypothetical protein